MSNTKKIPGLIAGAGLVLALPMAPAMANDDRVEVSSAGQCTGSARWELKAKERDGGVEVEFEVDSNVVGQKWDYTVRGPGGVLATGSRQTTAPSGSFSVEVRASGAATDSFRAVATHAGQTCDTTGAQGIGSDDNPGSDDGPGDDSGRNITKGQCSVGSEISLKVRKRDGGREAELEVDSGRNGQKWRYTIQRGRTTISKGVARTKGRSGSFSVEVRTKRSGKLTATAERTSGREDCSIDA
jgi:hypothetical protein